MLLEKHHGFSLATVRLIRAQYKIIKEQYGAITPKNIVDYARDPKSPLHRFFEWDDSVAAEKYRLMQAGRLTRTLLVFEVKKDGAKVPTRVYVSHEKKGVRQYDELPEVLSDPISAQQFLDDMKRELDRVVRRFETYVFCAKSIKLVREAMKVLDEEIVKEKKRDSKKKSSVKKKRAA